MPAEAGERAREVTYFHLISFQIENTTHRVPRYGFEKWSKSLFHDMFSLPPGGPVTESYVPEGSSDDNPIYPPDCSNLEFESLMKIMYPQLRRAVLATADNALTLTKDEWSAALKLSRQWDMPEISTLIIKNISTLPLSATEKVLLGRRFSHEPWLMEGYTELVKNCDSHSIADLGASIGWEAAARVVSAARSVTPYALIASQNNATGILVSRTDLQCKRGGHSPTPHWNEFCNQCKTRGPLWLPLSAGCVTGSGGRLVFADAATKVREMFKDELGLCVVDKW